MNEKQNTKFLKEDSLSENSNKCTVLETVSFDASSISKELKENPQWGLWKFEQRDGRIIKVSYMVQGYKASIKDPGTLTDFEKAHAIMNENSGTNPEHDFRLTENDHFIFFDKEEIISPNSYSENSNIDESVHLTSNEVIEGGD